MGLYRAPSHPEFFSTFGNIALLPIFSSRSFNVIILLCSPWYYTRITQLCTETFKDDITISTLKNILLFLFYNFGEMNCIFDII